MDDDPAKAEAVGAPGVLYESDVALVSILSDEDDVAAIAIDTRVRR